MPLCPTCSTPLRTIRQREGIYFLCDQCSGRAVTVPQIRRVAGDLFATKLLRKINTEKQIGERRCPFCSRNMSRFTLDDPVLVLDGCRPCNLVWFDPNEFEVLPEQGPANPHELPQRAREAIALYQVQQMAGRARAEDPIPDSGWKTIPALFGLPVELEDASSARWPLMTWVLTALIVLVSVWGFSNLKAAVEQYGFVPQNAWRDGGLTVLTSFFLHAGVFHLASNLYFLVLFGNHVEDYLGRWRFVCLILLAAIAGDLLHVLMQPNSAIPSVGASGGIAGVIAFYALEFPRAHLGFLLRFYWKFTWVQLPAWGAFALWLGLQAIGAIEQVNGFSRVNSFAHLGGVMAGFLGWVVWRKLNLGPTQGT